jgi:hypothetical protein
LTGEQRNGVAVKSAGGQGALDRELNAGGRVLAAEQHHVNDLAGGLRSSDALGDLGPQLVKTRGPVTAVAFLAQRQRPCERPRLALQKIEVVVELHARAVPAREALMSSDLAPVMPERDLPRADPRGDREASEARRNGVAVGADCRERFAIDAGRRFLPHPERLGGKISQEPPFSREALTDRALMAGDRPREVHRARLLEPLVELPDRRHPGDRH